MDTHTQTRKIAELKRNLFEAAKMHGEQVYGDTGVIEDDQGYMQLTYNISVDVYKLETDSNYLYIINVRNNGDVNEIDILEDASDGTIDDDVREYLNCWDSEWIEDFEHENIL